MLPFKLHSALSVRVQPTGTRLWHLPLPDDSVKDAKNNPCCTNDCMFLPEADNVVCQPTTTCGLHSICSGNSSACPQQEPSGATFCGCESNNCALFPATATSVCNGSTCGGSICEYYGALPCDLYGSSSCQVRNQTLHRFESDRITQLACQGPGWGNGTACISTMDIQNRPKAIVNGVFLLAGTSCNKCEMWSR